MIRSLGHFVSVAAFVLAAALLAGSTGIALADKRVALVIGNSNYQNVPLLPNPTRDAQAIFQKLKASGFDVDKANLDLGYLTFRRALDDFADKASNADVAVVFFAGHGVEIQGKNYMIPVDARLQSQRDALREAIPMDDLLSAVGGARNLRLIILDACRDNPFQMTRQYVRGESLPNEIITRGLGRIESSYTMVAYAAAAGSVAEDGSGDHSPFTQALLDKFFEAGLGIRVAFGRVVDQVQRTTRGKQLPYLNAALGEDDIALIPGRPKDPPSPVASAPVPSVDWGIVYDRFERLNTKEGWVGFLRQSPPEPYRTLGNQQLQKWIEAEAKVAALDPQKRQTLGPPGPEEREWGVFNKDDPAQLQDFIQRYPNSSHLPEATLRLDVLENNAWERIKDASDQAAFQTFIQRYPNSRYVVEAQGRIKQLQQAAEERARQQRLEAARKEARDREEAEARRRAEADKKAEQLAWDKAKGSKGDVTPAFEDFINRYPNSSYRVEAQQLLDQARQFALEAEAKKAQQQAKLEQPSAKNASAPNTPELVTAAQKALKGLGCYPGQENGALDEATKQGIGRYLAAQGKPDAHPDVTDDFVTELENPNANKCPTSKIVSTPPERPNERQKRPVAKQEERPPQVKQLAEPAPQRVPSAPPTPAKPSGQVGVGF
jgi:TolA-binding protein